MLVETDKQSIQLIQEKSLIGGFIKDRPNGVDEVEWGEEKRQKWATDDLALFVQDILEAIGFTSRPQPNVNGDIWVYNLWFRPENIDPEKLGKVRYIKKAEDWRQFFAEHNLVCKYNREVQMFVIREI